MFVCQSPHGRRQNGKSAIGTLRKEMPVDKGGGPIDLYLGIEPVVDRGIMPIDLCRGNEPVVDLGIMPIDIRWGIDPVVD